MLTRFLQTLSGTGLAELPWPGKDVTPFIRDLGKDPHDRHQATKLLANWHTAAVAELPGPPLPFHPAAALWGAMMTARAAAMICFRQIDKPSIELLLGGRDLPDPETPAAHFSADLCLRHWAGLARMARSLSEDDPLVLAMHAFTGQVPLSSIGLELPLPLEHPIFLHSGLRQLLAERAMDRSDQAALAHPLVAATLRTKLGAYTATLGRALPSPVPLLS
ncbi:MAG: hypothetical protein JWO82_3348 [Akkermansiaceae bacterium]|nr:hypothetical protein [Akkermansiaceae bacterium]